MRNEPGDMNQESVLVDSHEKCLNDVTQIVKKPQTRKLFTYFFYIPVLDKSRGSPTCSQNDARYVYSSFVFLFLGSGTTLRLGG